MKSEKKIICHIKKYLCMFFILAAALFVTGSGALMTGVTVQAEAAPQEENADVTGDTESEESNFILFFFAGILILIAVVAAVVTVIVSASGAVIVTEEDDE